jgi:hypothetical protein
MFGNPRLEELDGELVTPPGFDFALIACVDRGLFYPLWSRHLEYDTSLRGSLGVDGRLVCEP